ncbi:Eco57I restriction-modification methylase domain-containing protein [bacterium]|nr:Eco57I restriction-modification methylase domain-containing protein [bacterium]
MNRKEKLFLNQIKDFYENSNNYLENKSSDFLFLDSFKKKYYFLETVKRALFLKFLQQKISKKFKFPLISEKYFSEMAVINSQNYHKDIFNRLLFDVLPVKTELRVKEVRTAHFALTPFISEDFFHKNDIDIMLENSDIYIDNSWFLKLFSIFNQFEFSIDEFIDDKNIITPQTLALMLEYISEDSTKKGKGSFYTPQDMVTFILQESYPLLKNLKKVRVLEPSIGAGAFLIPLIKFLKDNLVLNSFSEIKDFIYNNLTLIDIDSDAISIAKMRLALTLINYQEIIDHEHNRGVETLSKFSFFYEKNIFDIKNQSEFNDFFKEKFDFVIGNPPYIGEKGNKEIFQKAKEGYFGKYYQSKMDFYYFFFFYAIDVLNSDGVLSFITTNYFLTATSGKNLRKTLSEKVSIEKMFDFQEVRVFKLAIGQHNLISILKKSYNPDSLATFIRYEQSGSEPVSKITNSNKNISKKRYKIDKIVSQVKQKELYFGENYYIFPKNIEENSLIKKMEHFPTLSSFASVNQGIVSGCDSAFIFDSEKIEFKNEKSSDFIKRFYKNSDIYKYTVNENTTKRVLYINKAIDLDRYSEIKEHFLKYESILKARIKRYDENYIWYKIHRPRDKKIFENLKIVAPQRSIENRFALSESDFFGSADIYYITLKNSVPFSIYYLLALLNSKPYYEWLYHRGKRKGKILELYSIPLLQIPIYIPTESEDEKISKIVKDIIENQKYILNSSTDKKDLILKKIIELQNRIDQEIINFINK